MLVPSTGVEGALQVAERMLEAIRKDYWKADEQTKRELVAVYREVAAASGAGVFEVAAPFPVRFTPSSLVD